VLDFSDQTFVNILQRQLNRIPAIYDKREGSLIDTALRPESWQFELLYWALTQIQKNSNMETAEDPEAVDLLAAMRGVYRNDATAAVCEGAFNVDVGLEAVFSTIAGMNSVNFTTTKALGLGIDGLYHYEMTCETPGTAGNQYSGNLLAVTHIDGLTIAMIVGLLIPGSAQENNNQVKADWLATFLQAAFGGNIAGYRTEILKIDGVGGVQVYPVPFGGGTVLCSIIGADYNPASSTLTNIVQNNICPPDAGNTTPSANGYGLAPIGAQVFIATATPFNIDVTMDIALIDGASPIDIQNSVKTAIEVYFLTLRQDWGKPLLTNRVEYPLNVYLARVFVAAMSVTGLLNVTNVTMNGAASDIVLTQTAALQQLPMLGAVTCNIV